MKGTLMEGDTREKGTPSDLLQPTGSVLLPPRCAGTIPLRKALREALLPQDCYLSALYHSLGP
jgi:hypothetical protein